MSTLGTLYVAMEENKTDLEKILELYQEAKQIKYLYDEKNKLVPINRISTIGKGVCFDHARYQASLAKKYKLPYRCFIYVSMHGDKPYRDPKNIHDLLGLAHATCFIHVGNKYYHCNTTADRKYLTCIDEDKLDYCIAEVIKNRTAFNVRDDVIHGITGKDVSRTVTGGLIDYYNRYRDIASEDVYEVPDFADTKYDGMTYRKLIEHVTKNFKPYEFDEKVLENFKGTKAKDFNELGTTVA